ncbi:unnamed protein product [Protopolystoma xenopodis]|uniref:Ion transport domain-containing protein n=1 Tax=Protopolystoma xenopodis TaxID=117903 RepID=A0A3S5A8T4_9PLAT|nr:unnamed protein product [Protopolystoma xenopodis]
MNKEDTGCFLVSNREEAEKFNNIFDNFSLFVPLKHEEISLNRPLKPSLEDLPDRNVRLVEANESWTDIPSHRRTSPLTRKIGSSIGETKQTNIREDITFSQRLRSLFSGQFFPGEKRQESTCYNKLMAENVSTNSYLDEVTNMRTVQQRKDSEDGIKDRLNSSTTKIPATIADLETESILQQNNRLQIDAHSPKSRRLRHSLLRWANEVPLAENVQHKRGLDEEQEEVEKLGDSEEDAEEEIEPCCINNHLDDEGYSMDYNYQRRKSRAVLYHFQGNYGRKENKGKMNLNRQLKNLSGKTMPEYKMQEMKKSYFVLLHYGLFRIVWDWILLLFTFYIAFMVPYNAAFATEAEEIKVPGVIDLIVELLFITGNHFVSDVILNFRTTFVSKSGQVVNDQRKIALNYLRGWFTLDLLAAIPFDFIILLLNLVDMIATASTTSGNVIGASGESSLPGGAKNVVGTSGATAGRDGSSGGRISGIAVTGEAGGRQNSASAIGASTTGQNHIPTGLTAASAWWPSATATAAAAAAAADALTLPRHTNSAGLGLHSSLSSKEFTVQSNSSNNISQSGSSKESLLLSGNSYNKQQGIIQKFRLEIPKRRTRIRRKLKTEVNHQASTVTEKWTNSKNPNGQDTALRVNNTNSRTEYEIVNEIESEKDINSKSRFYENKI